jgi:hypothetical protein
MIGYNKISHQLRNENEFILDETKSLLKSTIKNIIRHKLSIPHKW